MIMDKLTAFALKQNFFGTAATAKIGDALDLTAFPTDMGEGYPMYLVVLVTTAMAGGTAMTVNLVTAANAALDSGPVTLLSSAAVAQAAATAGTQVLVVALPKASYKRYLGVTVTRTGTSTAGAISAFLTQDPPSWRAYPEGLN